MRTRPLLLATAFSTMRLEATRIPYAFERTYRLDVCEGRQLCNGVLDEVVCGV